VRLARALALAVGIALPLWWRQLRFEREVARAFEVEHGDLRAFAANLDGAYQRWAGRLVEGAMREGR
jgi:hypothetical protein